MAYDTSKSLHIKTKRRFLYAYLTTFTVIGSYLWLNFKARLRGRSYKEEQMPRLHRRNARRVEGTILKLQGLFIKVGQLFSIMSNFLPEEFRRDLENLQDAVPARPYSQIETRIREELGAGPEEIFASFSKVPIASASLGQVHEARTHEGHKVAVKVQHLGVEEMTRSDLKTIRHILGIVKLFLRVKGLDNYYHEIKAMVREELDFEHEARHIKEIGRNFIENPNVLFPDVYEELSTQRVLTLEFVSGFKITDRDQMVQRGLDPEAIARELVTTYCQMIFIDGVYHADPHPGNILVTDEGRLVLLDFGAVGHLSKSMREGISSFLEAIIKADEKQLLGALRAMGFLQVGGNQSEAATRVIEHFHRRFQDEIRLDSLSLSALKIDPRKGLESLADIESMGIGIRELSEAFHMPRQWVLLERTGLLLAGLCTHLAPEMRPTETIRPYLEEFVLGKDRDWAEMLFDVSREKFLSIISLPSQIEKAIQRTLDGNVKFQVRGIPESANLLYFAGQQLIFTALTLGSGAAGIYFHHLQEQELMRYAVYAAGGFVSLLFLSMLRARRFRRRCDR